jgi:hypothetical protein
MQNAVEPPLGIDVSYVEPCGEPHEIALAAEIARGGRAMEAPSQAAPASPSPAVERRDGAPNTIRVRRLK